MWRSLFLQTPRQIQLCGSFLSTCNWTSPKSDWAASVTLTKKGRKGSETWWGEWILARFATRTFPWMLLCSIHIVHGVGCSINLNLAYCCSFVFWKEGWSLHEVKSTRGEVRERSPGSPVSPMRPGESPDGQERRRRCPTFLPEGQATQDVEFSPMSRGIASHRGPGTPAEQSQQSPVATGGGGLGPPDYAVRLAMEPFLQNMAQVVGELVGVCRGLSSMRKKSIGKTCQKSGYPLLQKRTFGLGLDPSYSPE